MTLHLPTSIESDLRRLAERQGRDVESLAEEAIRQYLDAANITDLTPDQIGDLQMGLAPELPPTDKWDSNGRGNHAPR